MQQLPKEISTVSTAAPKGSDSPDVLSAQAFFRGCGLRRCRSFLSEWNWGFGRLCKLELK